MAGVEIAVCAPAANRPNPVGWTVEYTSRKTPPLNDHDVGVPATTCGYGVASAVNLSVRTLLPVGGWLGSSTSACPSGEELVGSLPVYAHSSQPVRYLSASCVISVRFDRSVVAPNSVISGGIRWFVAYRLAAETVSSSCCLQSRFVWKKL